MRHLTTWTQVAQPFPTHYDSKGNTVSRLDRAFIACPISLLLKLSIGCCVVGTPEEIFANGDTDHAPVALCSGRCFRPPASDPPIPRWVGKHPNFMFHLDSLCGSVSVLDFEVSQQSIVYKND